MISLAKATFWTASSTLIKIGAGLLVIKLLAASFGPEGVGLAGNFRQLITVLAVLSGAGIFNGITKYIAEYQQQPTRLSEIIGTSVSIVSVSSLLLTVVFLCFADKISFWLFSSTDYAHLIQWLAFIQIAIAFANFFLAILKGYRDAFANALSIIMGCLIGLLAYLYCYYHFGYSGALAGLALIPAMALLPSAFMVSLRKHLLWSDFRIRWNKLLAGQLGKFTLMTIITCITMPVAYVLMRNLLAKTYSWHEVGIWQGVTTISDAYLQFITAAFSVYLLPTFSRLTNKHDIKQELLRTLRFVLLSVMIISLIIWLLRHWIILLLFSPDFSTMSSLFAWQLMGDILKVASYVFGYIIIAKASLRLYILAEVSQFILLITTSTFLIPANGALGAAQSYMVTYIGYFLLCCLAFTVYMRREK